MTDDINYVVQQILALDQKAVEIEKNTDLQADKIRTYAFNKIKKDEDETLTKTREDGKTQYDEAIILAQEQAEQKIKKADSLKEQMFECFNKIRESEAQRILETLLSGQE